MLSSAIWPLNVCLSWASCLLLNRTRDARRLERSHARSVLSSCDGGIRRGPSCEALHIVKGELSLGKARLNQCLPLVDHRAQFCSCRLASVGTGAPGTSVTAPLAANGALPNCALQIGAATAAFGGNLADEYVAINS